MTYKMIVISLTVLCAGLVYSIIKFQELYHPAELQLTDTQFVLDSANGPWNLKGNSKKINFVYFGFTHCPDICPLAMTFYGQALSKLSAEEKQEVNFIFISVDHKRDNVQTVAKYVSHFGSEVIGLSGSEAQIEKLSNQYQFVSTIEEQPGSADPITVSHPNRIYVLDQDITLLDSISPPTSAEELLEAIQKYRGHSWAGFIRNLFIQLPVINGAYKDES